MTAEPTAADWAAFVSLGVGGWAACAALLYLVVDAEPQDFDPRPVLRPLLAAAHQGVVHAGHDVNRAIAAIQRAARRLLDLLTPSAPEATR